MEEVIKEETSRSFFYKKVIQIGLPITLSQLLTSLLAFIDTIMVSSLGNNAVAAVSVAANFYFLMIMINFGLVSGLAIFFAQYWGNKDIKSIHKTFLVALISSLAITSVFFIFGHFFGDFVIGLYNNSNDVVNGPIIQELGVKYIRIAAFSYITTAVSFVIMMLMRSVEKVIFPQIITGVVVALNTFLNYVLINGNLGFEAMGVEGAAIATLISSIVGVSIFIIYMISTKIEVFKVKFSVFKEISRDFVKVLLRKALPVAINETFWGLGMTMYLIAFSYINVDALTSYPVASQVMGLFWVLNAGISSASAIMLGNKLGEGKYEVAKDWGKRFVKLTFGAGVVLGIILFFTSPYIPYLFTNITENVKEDIVLILMVFSFYIPIKFVNAMHIIGTLRSGGDTLFTLFAEVGALWIIGVPLAFVLSLTTSLPIYIIVAIVNVEELIKFIIVNKRFLTYKWVKNLT